HHATTLLFGKEVGDQRGAGGVVAGLADADRGPAGEELEIAGGETREEGGEAPDRDADADNRLAAPAVAPVAEGEGGDGVDEKEGGAEKPDLGVIDVELFLNQWRRGG